MGWFRDLRVFVREALGDAVWILGLIVFAAACVLICLGLGISGLAWFARNYPLRLTAPSDQGALSATVGGRENR